MPEDANNRKPDVVVHGRKLAGANTKFDVFFDDVEWTAGVRVPEYLVVDPRAPAAGLVSGVAVLPVVDGRFALIRLYRHAIRDHVWEVPRGFVEPGENPLTAAMRELEEETGLACPETGMRPLGLIAPEGGVIAVRFGLYAALDCRQARAFDAAEFGHHDLRFFDAEEMAAMAAGSEIQDPSTLIAYFRLQALTDGGRNSTRPGTTPGHSQGK